MFLREDLPPEVRVARAKQRREEQELTRNPPPLLPGNRTSRSRSVSESSDHSNS